LRSRKLRTGVDAVVPVNVLRKSKTRLAPILTPAERERLSVSMLKDVLSALKRARRVRSTTIVSADRQVSAIARQFRARFLWEGKRKGLNKGVKLAVTKAEKGGASAVLVVHSDLPLLKPIEIDAFLEKSHAYSVALTPSKDGGTNALLLRPARVIKPVFGKYSFQKHLRATKRKKARHKVLEISGIRFDVDEPKDVIQLMHQPLRNETGRFLKSLKNHWEVKAKSKKPGQKSF
jgi:2-phospho-L-lactate/phosphoenolpyruvate guanylyltransferase